MKKKLSFFGASVTAQKTGYATQFPEEIYHKYIYGYAGSHLHSAGICMIDEALNTNPDYCFVEWFTPKMTDSPDEITKYVYTIITKCLEKCTIPIFLFFPKKDPRDPWEMKLEQYQFIISLLNTYFVPYIEVYKHLKESFETVLRDSVHTSDNGSEIYFKIINEQFLDIQNKEWNIQFPPSTTFENIASLSINKTIQNKITFEGNARIISIYQDVGPFSNKINLITDGVIKPYTLIDQDCYYIRSTFALSSTFKSSFTVQLLNDEKPKNLYKKEINWETMIRDGYCYPEVNEMRFKRVYFLGNINTIIIDGDKI